MNELIKWPSRDEWAKDRHSFYYDLFEYLELDTQLSSYANQEEVESAIKALRTLWKSEGVKMRALNVPKALQRQKGESSLGRYNRVSALPKDVQELINKAGEFGWHRQEVTEVIKELRDNEVPKMCRFFNSECGISDGNTRWIWRDVEVDKTLRPIAVRYQDAYSAATEKTKQQILARPIDDEAWAVELDRRAELERDHPHWFKVEPMEISPAASL